MSAVVAHGSSFAGDSAAPVLAELQREAAVGSVGTESCTREIRTISLHDFDQRREIIRDELWAAATEVGFFQVVGHGIDLATVDHAFAMSKNFFALPADVKKTFSQTKGRNAGWEYMTQVRPSTGTPDQKESYQITGPRMEGLWPSENELAGFRSTFEDFERRCWKLSMDLLSCFAEKIGLERNFFTNAHRPSTSTYQSTLRLLHYYALPSGLLNDRTIWRAGAHTDFDVLTLLFQREGQGGLQVLPGAEAEGQEWTPVQPSNEAITCNIGDMLMRWSDDRLPSNFHRVRMPRSGEDTGPRYSIAFFAQANEDVLVESPGGKYPTITAGEYIKQRIAANFSK